MDYADRGLRLAAKAQGGEDDRFVWWRRKDLLTRTLMANYVRDHMPAGEALGQALRDAAQDWAIVKSSELQGEHDSIIDASMIAEPAGLAWHVAAWPSLSPLLAPAPAQGACRRHGLLTTPIGYTRPSSETSTLHKKSSSA